MHLRIEPSAEPPIYRQIVRQILDGIASGRVRPGQRLSSQRDLAELLVISPLTVKKAYDELERGGYLETRRGQGTFVRNAPSPAPDLERLRTGLRRLVSEAWAAGVPVETLLEMLRGEDAQLRRERESRETQDP